MTKTDGRGRIDKRQSILAAAFVVFARDGYRSAGVDVIAAEAGVAKHTIYNHFGDKESLFRAAIAELSDETLTKNLAAVELVRDQGDLTEMLVTVGLRLAECYCNERAWALRRLLHAELANMPELLDIVRDRAADRVYEALADRFARLALAGRLNLGGEPTIAAEHFGALLTGPLESRSRLGTRKLTAAELLQVTEHAVRAFLRAYGTGDSQRSLPLSQV